MKKAILSILYLCTISCALTQEVDTIKVNSEKQVVVIDEIILSSKTKIEEVTILLGTPTRIEKIADIDRYYIYDKLGLSFDVGKNSTLEAVIVNYNWDKDKKAANGTYNGVLLIDNFLINDKSKVDDIKIKTKLKDIICLGPKMCMTKPSQSSLALLLGYNDEANITQIGFGFSK